mgnify:FL=1
MPERENVRRFVLAAAAAGTLLVSSAALAAEATLMRAQLTRDEPGESPGLFLAASYEFDLPQPLREALQRGIALYFRHDFQLRQERWYWLDRTLEERHFFVRLSYDPLTQRYGGLSQSFDTYEQALPLVKNIRRWRVGPSDVIRDPNDYTAEVRFSLDASKLPKPMQVTTAGADEWTLTSEWTPIEIPPEVAETE